MSGRVRIINYSAAALAEGQETASVQSQTGAEAVSYWPWIGAAAVLTVLFGVIFFLCLRKYLHTQKLARQAKERKIEARRLKEAESVTERREPVHEAKEFSAQPDYGSTISLEPPALEREPAFPREAAPVRQTQEEPAPGIYVGKVHDIGRRSSQQDSFGISGDGQQLDDGGKGIFAIVADGMGGLKNGGAVSALVTMTMMQAFDVMSGQVSPDQALLGMLGEANERVNDMLKPSGQGKSGSTVVAAIIRERMLYWIAVGDSHIYLYRNGALMQINRDHVYSVVLDEMAARGEISSREAAQNPQRKALTSFIGMGRIEKIDRNIRPLTLQKKDRVLLMTDGVFGTLSEEELTAAMKLPVAESSEAIHQMIRQKNAAAQDNYTALILECM